MPKLLQLNVCSNCGSTGRIAEQIGVLARKKGWDSYMAYGRSYNDSHLISIKVGNVFGLYEHYAEYRLFDNDGLASRKATRQLIDKIRVIEPDLIHLHNIHDHWLNYRILFEYLNTIDIPIVWTQHDCWSFTGDCGYFSQLACNQYINGCTINCPYRKRPIARRFINHAKEHYELKKQLFCDTKNLTLVPVSHWLEGVLEMSFLKNRPIRTILNGVDVNVFRPVEVVQTSLQKYGLECSKYVLGVATVWSERKGFDDYCKLVEQMPDGVKVVLVGLNEKRRKVAAKFGIVGIARTENVGELVALYNGASIVMNLSYEETFGLTTVEGFACGTPSIVYNATASPELVTADTGIIVEPGDIDGVAEAVRQLLSIEKPVDACRERAMLYFNKDDKFEEYINLYNELLHP